MSSTCFPTGSGDTKRMGEDGPSDSTWSRIRNVGEIASTGKSLMPEGVEKSVAPGEMADLIAVLLKIQH
jgi:hypothetical protein